MILPDATLGVLGGGQLGRMFTFAARSMGYEVVVLDPDPHSPAGAIANQHIEADYHDHAALQLLGSTCSAVTTEFENVPADSLRHLERLCPVRPSAMAVAICQDRIQEKTFLQEHGLATAPFQAVFEPADLDDAVASLKPPLLLKTAAMGYDGKGQMEVADIEDARAAFDVLGGGPFVLEERVDLKLELSVILARGVDGNITTWPVAENRHLNGILDTTLVPARVDTQVAVRAREMAAVVADALAYCGVMAVEFFLTASGELLVNEIAPRPHNSGHYTVDASLTSQFEQQVRMLCGLPPGDTALHSPVVMVNLLGDLWRGDKPPPWDAVLSHPQAKLHLYGKRHARPGRKMGHYNCLADDLAEAESIAEEIRRALETRDE